MRLAGAFLIATLPAWAAGGVEIWTGNDLKASAGKLAPEAEAKSIAGKTLGSWGSHSASLWRRSKSGQAELHRLKTDLIVIEQGSATLVFGGTIPDARITAPNEVRGKSIEHGESRKLVPGDIVRIPAGTPHQFILEKGEEVAYFALKLAR
jgi:mannose-6-phosphate isomerase-like protein (cupin superfamily)